MKLLVCFIAAITASDLISTMSVAQYTYQYLWNTDILSDTFGNLCALFVCCLTQRLFHLKISAVDLSFWWRPEIQFISWFLDPLTGTFKLTLHTHIATSHLNMMTLCLMSLKILCFYSKKAHKWPLFCRKWSFFFFQSQIQLLLTSNYHVLV
jgi:hypothetical protein